MEQDLFEAVAGIFNPDKDIIWMSSQNINDDLVKHYENGKTHQEFIQAVFDVWQKNHKIKLIDGTYLTDCPTYHPWIYLLSESTRIIIKALEPDCWNTPEAENDLPDFLRLERFGIYDTARITAVEEKFKLRVKLSYKPA